MDIETIVRALRCSVTQGEKDCAGCRYRVLEEVKPGLPIPPDVEIDGVHYWESCDVDRIAMDAAEALEKLSEGGCFYAVDSGGAGRDAAGGRGDRARVPHEPRGL